MRAFGVRLLVTAGLAMPVAVTAYQDHSSAGQSGTTVMGFDQTRTAHRFSLFTDGGAIDVTLRDSADAENRDAIRSHLQHIADMFSDGIFDAPMLVHNSKNVPGTKVMASRKDRIRYEYVETPGGGRVNIITTDAEAVAAVHQFLKFQIDEHRTGDRKDVQRR